MSQGEVGSGHVWVAQTVKRRLNILKSNLERKRVQDIPD
jgi:hypothetical protein